MKPRKPRIIICLSCGKEVVTKGIRTLRCPECAARHKSMAEKKARQEKRIMNGDNPENNWIWFHDSPEDIQKCLNCKRPTCRNCLQYRKKG